MTLKRERARRRPEVLGKKGKKKKILGAILFPVGGVHVFVIVLVRSNGSIIEDNIPLTEHRLMNKPSQSHRMEVRDERKWTERLLMGL